MTIKRSTKFKREQIGKAIEVKRIEGQSIDRVLKIANERNVLAVMLTAHALSVESTAKSFKAGAAYYVPKEKMANIDSYLNDVLEAKERGKSTWWRWLDRFGAFYDKKFGQQWRQENKEFWKKFPY